MGRPAATVPSQTKAASAPHSTAGRPDVLAPDRPSRASAGLGWPGVAVGGGAGGGVSATSRDTTTRRRAALNRGVHVVSVNRLSAVLSSTLLSVGDTSVDMSTTYLNGVAPPAFVVTLMTSP